MRLHRDSPGVPHRHLGGALLTIALLCGGLGTALANGSGIAERRDGQTADRRASRVAATTMSPFCPGKTIDACPSPSAAAWRADIRQWSDSGLSSSEIRKRLQARVPGFDLSGRPGARWDWALPVGAMALATLWLGLLLRRLRRPSKRDDAPVADPHSRTGAPDALDARLDWELRR